MNKVDWYKVGFSCGRRKVVYNKINSHLKYAIKDSVILVNAVMFNKIEIILFVMWLCICGGKCSLNVRTL